MRLCLFSFSIQVYVIIRLSKRSQVACAKRESAFLSMTTCTHLHAVTCMRMRHIYEHCSLYRADAELKENLCTFF